ncbi:aspartic peptidase domain-containing protein, partial [Vararia minispora EC-137]
ASVVLDNSNNTQWTGEISIGTPARNFTAMFDTGSSDLVIPTGAGCSNCYQSVSYDPKSSSTSHALGKSFSLNYGSGAVSGMQYEDSVSVADVTATGQTLLAANHTAANFFKNMNALVGLGFASTTSAGVKSLVQNMIDQKTLSKAVFGFKLADGGSELTFGGTNGNLYKGSPTYTSVQSGTRWQIPFEKMTLWDRTLQPNVTTAVIDSGTTLILADEASVEAFYSTVYGSQKMSNGMWSVNCYNIPQVNVTFSGKQISIPSDVFTLGQIAAQSDQCLGGVQPASGLTFWVMGDILMRNAYTIFDAAQRRIGFADLK